MKVDILGLGHPRTGTGYTSKLLREWGLDVGHEQMGKDGTVTWQMLKEHKFEEPVGWPWAENLIGVDRRPGYDTLIYNVRDPKTSIPSIVFTEFIHYDTTNFLNQNFNIKFGENRVENAIKSILKFDQLIMDMNPHIIYRIEKDRDFLFKELIKRNYKVSYTEYSDKYNKRSHPKLNEINEEFNSVNDRLKESINLFCNRLGYEELY